MTLSTIRVAMPLAIPKRPAVDQGREAKRRQWETARQQEAAEAENRGRRPQLRGLCGLVLSDSTARELSQTEGTLMAV